MFVYRGPDDPPLDNAHIEHSCMPSCGDSHVPDHTQQYDFRAQCLAPLVLAVLRIVSALLLIDQGLTTAPAFPASRRA